MKCQLCHRPALRASIYCWLHRKSTANRFYVEWKRKQAQKGDQK